jgi:hypothetical protein
VNEIQQKNRNTKKSTNVDTLASEVEQEQGGKISQVKRDFAVKKVTNPGLSNAQIAREVANYAQPGKMGHQLAHDPKVLALQAKIEEYIHEVYQCGSSIEIDEAFIKNGLLREAVTANHSRDRRGALELLGKAEGIFKEVVEHRDLSADDEFLQNIKETFGEEAARIAAEELGLEWDEETIK